MHTRSLTLPRLAFAAFAFASSGAMTGCANVSTDPAQGGLIGGIKGLTTGAYDERIAEKQASLERMNEAERQLAASVGAADSRLKAVDADIAKRKAAIERLKTSIAEIDKRIEAVRRTNAIAAGMEASAKAAVARREAELKPLLAQRDQLKRMTSDLEANERLTETAFAKGYAGGLASASAGGTPSLAAAPADGTAKTAGQPPKTLDASLIERGRAADRQAADAERLAASLKVAIANLER